LSESTNLRGFRLACEGFEEYLDASALLGRSKMDYEQFRSSFPSVSEGFWVFLNDPSLTAIPEKGDEGHTGGSN
jgi:hypothetical protein